MNLYNTVFLNQEKIILKLKDRIRYLTGKSNRFSGIRLTVFLSGLILCIAAYIISIKTGWICTIISLGAFALTVHLHNKLLEGMRKCYSYLKIKEENLARMKIDWKNIPEPIDNSPPSEMSSEKDLDLTGKYSLHNLIDLAVSAEGSALLRIQLSGSVPDIEIIKHKQNIITELSGLVRFRDRFILKSRLVSNKILKCADIIAWIKNSGKTVISEKIFYVSLALIAAYSVMYIMNVAGIIPPVWIMVFVIYFFIYSSNQKKISTLVEESTELESQLKKFTALIYMTENYSFTKQPNLNEFLKVFKNGNDSAAVKLHSLQKIISALMVRENPLLRIILNIVFPFDLYFSIKLVKIKDEIKNNIEEWCSKLNELECLISIANFSYLNPDYIFPDISEKDTNIFKAKELGHPLISRDKKILNNFSFDRENEIVIITGSNMSGKSTFLRSAGINICLAYAGAPVNAKSFYISVYDLFTCIKVNDSVVDGISYFYAEVKRLRQLLDKLESNKFPVKFFLIDEIFKGTNNKERLSGSRAFIKKLSQMKATGFVTTHDLELVNLEKEIDSIENYHFREEISDDKMKFDYLIHKGPCPTTNALKIMKLSGLPVE